MYQVVNIVRLQELPSHKLQKCTHKYLIKVIMSFTKCKKNCAPALKNSFFYTLILSVERAYYIFMGC